MHYGGLNFINQATNLKKLTPFVKRVRYKRNRKRKAGAGRTHTYRDFHLQP